MEYTDAFRHYNATPNNKQWSMSAFSKNGDLVISVWNDELKFNKDTKLTIYSVPLSSWGNNPLGRDEFKRNIQRALIEKSKVRLIKAVRPENYDPSANESDRSKAKGYELLPHLVGKVASFENEDIPVIVFGGNE